MADGTLAPEAGAHRGFYRPHGGFPAWQPADDPQEVLDEALAWAARNDRVDALDVLVARGARSSRRLPRHGARVGGRMRSRRRDRAPHRARRRPEPARHLRRPDHGEGVTALHLAAQNGDVAAVRALLAGGADPTVKDALFDGTPGDWASHFGHTRGRRA